MAIQITSDTIVKILVRRGSEFDRKLTLLSNGELGYSQDTQRLFVGDGFTLGGVSVGTKFHGFVASKDAYTSIAQDGDTLFQTTDGVLYVYDGSVSSWRSIHPKFGESLQRFGDSIDISEDLFQTGFTYVPADNVYNPDSINTTSGKVDFNANYISLSAAYSSFYFGNIFQKQVTNNLDATVNVDKNIFIQDISVNPNQLQIWASDPIDGDISIKGNQNNINIKSAGIIGLYSSDKVLTQATYGGSTGTSFTIFSDVTGTYANPNFDVRGLSRFRESAFFDKNLTISGNLSVYGDTSYYETNVVTTSALSVINSNNNFAALVVSQLSPTADQIVSIFNGATTNTNGRPILTVRDGAFVGVNTTIGTNFSTMGANFVVSGTTLFSGSPNNSSDAFIVRTGSGGIILNTPTSVAGTANNFNFTSNTTSPTNGKVFKINTTAVQSNNIGLEINSAVDTKGIKFLPDAAAGSFNPLTQVGDAVIVNYGGAGSDQAGGLVIGSWSGGTKGIRIAGDTGNVSVNAADSGGFKFYVNGTASFTGAVNAGAGITVTGNLAATGDVIAYNSSDKALKKNITVIDSALTKIDKISGVRFTWDSEKQSTYTGDDIGVLAQEIEEILPEAVTTREDGYKAVKYEKIIPLLIQAIKELKALTK